MTTLRVARLGLTGAGLFDTKLRVARLGLTGAPQVTLTLGAAQTVEPLAVITLTAQIVSGPAPDSYTWRRVSGPAVTFTGTGNQRSFPAPAHLDGTAVIIGVAGVIGGVTGPEATVVITSLPHLHWVRIGASWTPMGRLTLVGA